MAASISKVTGVPLDAFRQICKMLTSGKNFDRVLSSMDIVALSPSKCCCELTVGEEHANGQGTLHGGLTTTLLDFTTIAMVIASTGRLGVSMQLNTNFLQSAKIGEKVSMEAELVKVGKKVAFTKAALLSANGDLLAQGNNIIRLRSDKAAQELMSQVQMVLGKK